MIRTVSTWILWMMLLITGCGGGGSTTPPPDDPALLAHITGIRPQRALGVDTPGYAGDELTIEVLTSGETPTSIIWDFGGGAIPFGNTPPAAPMIELQIPGEYTLTVTITDSQGLTDSESFDYVVLPESHRIRSIAPSTPAGVVTQPVRFVADVDGEVEVIHWTFDGGTDVTATSDAQPLVALTEVGTHTATVRVSILHGPTVTRSFPFEVVASPWTEFHHQQNQYMIDSVLTTDGEFTILQFNNNGGQRFNLTQASVAELESPGTWRTHAFGPSAPFGYADLLEHDGHLGVLYIEASDFHVPELAVSDTLHPTSDSDWTVSRMGGTMIDVLNFALAGAEGQGWNALVYTQNQSLWWTAASTAVPQTGDWTPGIVGNVHGPTLSLVQHQGALISAVGTGSKTEIRVGQPGNFAAMLSGPKYTIPGRFGTLQSNGDRLMAIEDLDPEIGIAFANVDVPVRSEDWTDLSVGLFTNSTSQQHLQLMDDELIVTRSHFLGDGEFGPRLAMELLRRPLNDLSIDWTTEFVTAQTWLEPWAFPTPDGMILAWRPQEDGAELGWHVKRD